MDETILDMLAAYNCQSREDYENALKEIVQEVALLGLWRSKFFEHALFYGGTALRILYKLNRFSEDLDFSLLKTQKNFKLNTYLKAMEDELKSFGFKVSVDQKEKGIESRVESAFIKAGTHIHFLKANAPERIQNHIQSNEVLKIKVELDTDPPGLFNAEMKPLLQPIPFQVKTMPIEDLFAGKLHAVLAREWRGRVKGRDYYDMIWYIGRKAKYNIRHLKERLVQSGHWDKDRDLTSKDVDGLVREKIKGLNFEKAKRDVSIFLKPRERQSLELWDLEFFSAIIDRLESD